MTYCCNSVLTATARNKHIYPILYVQSNKRRIVGLIPNKNLHVSWVQRAKDQQNVRKGSTKVRRTVTLDRKSNAVNF